MPVPRDEHARTLAFADIALGQIKALAEPATPRNFEIWYNYATGYNPALNQLINQTLEQNGALDTVLELKRTGATRFVGMSGTLPNIVDHIAMGVFDVFQIPYSAVEREHEAIIAAAAKAGSGIVVRGGAAKGAPTEGKHEGVQWERWQKIDLRDLLAGSTPMEFILRFTFTHPDLHTNIVGTINPEHLRHNVDVLRQGPLPADVYAEAKRRLDAAGSSPPAA